MIVRIPEGKSVTISRFSIRVGIQSVKHAREHTVATVTGDAATTKVTTRVMKTTVLLELQVEKVGHAQTEEHVSGAVATAMVQVKRKHDIAALELLGDNRGVNHTPENVDNIMELAAAIIRVMMLDGLTTASRQKRTKILLGATLSLVNVSGSVAKRTVLMTDGKIISRRKYKNNK